MQSSAATTNTIVRLSVSTPTITAGWPWNSPEARNRTVPSAAKPAAHSVTRAAGTLWAFSVKPSAVGAALSAVASCAVPEPEPPPLTSSSTRFWSRAPTSPRSPVGRPRRAAAGRLGRRPVVAGAHDGHRPPRPRGPRPRHRPERPIGGVTGRSSRNRPNGREWSYRVRRRPSHPAPVGGGSRRRAGPPVSRARRGPRRARCAAPSPPGWRAGRAPRPARGRGPRTARRARRRGRR